MTAGADDGRRALIDYRLGQARSALRQAEILAGAKEWDGVVNRAYYAMFYAALALLLTKDLGASKHTGVLALLDREFVRTGQVPVKLSRWLREAFNLRQKADYGEFGQVTREQAAAVLDHAREFIATVSSLLKPS